MWTAPDGHLHAAVRRVRAARFAQATDLGPLKEVAISASSNEFALMWEVCTRVRFGDCTREVVRASTAIARAHFSAPQTLGPVAGTSARLSLQVGPHGDVLALWSGTRKGFVRAARLAGGSRCFDRAQILSNRHRRSHSVTAAIGRNGGLAVWIERRADGRVQVIGADVDSRERVGVRYPLSAPLERAAVPKVQAQDDGATAVWWRRTRGRYWFTRPPSWSIRTRAAGGSFASMVEIDGVSIDDVAVSLDGHGEVLALMVKRIHTPSACGASFVLLSAVWKAGTQPRPTVLDDCEIAGSPRIAVDASGRALAVWSRAQPPETTRPRAQAFISFRPPGAGFNPAEARSLLDDAQLQLAMRDDGGALLVWFVENGTLHAADER
jgi:hypothetical protein